MTRVPKARPVPKAENDRMSYAIVVASNAVTDDELWRIVRDAATAIAQQVDDGHATFDVEVADVLDVCVHCGLTIENVGGDHWLHVSDDPRTPIGSAQCVGDAWGEVATPPESEG